jgi:DNA helicase HerA-like ATPase
MAVFKFRESVLLGNVIGLDTGKVQVNVETKRLRLAKVGGLVAIKAPSDALEGWLIALVDEVSKSLGEWGEAGIIFDEDEEQKTVKNKEKIIDKIIDREINTVQVVLIGTLKAMVGTKPNRFSRSILEFPDIDSKCYALEGENLEKFMGIISEHSKGEHALDVGNYTLDPKAKAYLDGNKLFQRHTALLGITGSGKSWTVATILERAKELPSANLIVFDLHGEYNNLTYAKHLRVAGPDDLKKHDPAILFLPYWLLNADEMQSMFIDRSEFSAHNQVMAFLEAVTAAKKEVLQKEGKTGVLNSFTIDSPVPFSLEAVISKLAELNEEMVQGARGLKQGNFHGQFSRLLVRLNSKINDKRYGFLFQAPPLLHQYQALHQLAEMLMGFTQKGKDRNQIKVVDFSEVPSEILPVIVGLVARLVYQVQFWMEKEKRQPVVFVCDEAHLYLPKESGLNPPEERALGNFKKIAKEGRKYGVGLLVVSQRPSDVSETILSQCNNFITLRLTNGQDQDVVKRLLPDSMEGFADLLPILEIGEALIVGDAVLLPTRIKLSEPAEKPLSATINFWDEWSKADKQADIVLAVENMRKQSRR